MARVEPVDPLTVRADLEQRLLEWRSLIQDRKTHARRLLKQLIVGRLELTPNMEERYYGFRGTGTLLPVIAGVVPQSVPSPRGLTAVGVRGPQIGGLLRAALDPCASGG